MAEALGMIPALERFSEIEGTRPLSYEPVFQMALDDDCKTQCRIAIETRTTAYQVRSGEFGEEQLSVYLTVRRFDSLGNNENFVSELHRLAEHCERLADEFLVENVLQPLQKTIALK